MVSSAILLVGLASVMLIASQVANTPTASSQRLKAAEAVDEFANDVRYATFLITRTPHVLEFVVTDRTDDGTAERIRYEWSGVPGDPLQKSVNGSVPIAVVDSVQDVQFSVTTASETTSFASTTDSAETKLLFNENNLNSTREVTADKFSGQALDPSTLSAAGRLWWNATRVDFQASRSSSANEILLVQLRSAGDPNSCPTSEVLGEAQLAENALSGAIGWNSVSFSSPIQGLQFHRKYALVLARTTADGTSSTTAAAATLRTNINDSSPLTSDDGGATWGYNGDAQTNFRVWGTYTSSGPTYDLTRNYANRANVVLQAGTAAHSRINASIPLLNRPELLSAYWRTDFDDDPTATDFTRDNTGDWALASNGTFNTATLVDGVWLADGALESRPKNDFTTNTTVDVRCRNTSVGGNGAEIRINADRQGGAHAPLVVRVQRQPDDSQTLTLYGKSSDATDVMLIQRKNLSSDFVRFRLTILPTDNVVNLAINDKDEGTYAYPTYAPTDDNRFLTFSANTSSAEYDYVELRVAE